MQINTIRPKTGKEDNLENKKTSCPTCVQLNFSSGSTFLPSIINIPEMALEFNCKNI